MQPPWLTARQDQQLLVTGWSLLVMLMGRQPACQQHPAWLQGRPPLDNAPPQQIQQRALSHIPRTCHPPVARAARPQGIRRVLPLHPAPNQRQAQMLHGGHGRHGSRHRPMGILQPSCTRAAYPWAGLPAWVGWGLTPAPTKIPMAKTLLDWRRARPRRRLPAKPRSGLTTVGKDLDSIQSLQRALALMGGAGHLHTGSTTHAA